MIQVQSTSEIGMAGVGHHIRAPSILLRYCFYLGRCWHLWSYAVVSSLTAYDLITMAIAVLIIVGPRRLQPLP